MNKWYMRLDGPTKGKKVEGGRRFDHMMAYLKEHKLTHTLRPVRVKDQLCWIWHYGGGEVLIKYINHFDSPSVLEQEILAAEIRQKRKGKV